MRRRYVTYTIAVAVLIAVIVVLALSGLWWPAVVVALAAAFGTGYAWSWQGERRKLRSDPAFRTQERMIRHLWETTRCMPAGTILTDPVTGRGLGAERARGFLTLLVVEPPERPDDQTRPVIVHRYSVGFARRPIRPPLMHDISATDGPPARPSWRKARQAARLAEQTGTGDTDISELAALVGQLDRAIAARPVT